MTKYLLIEDVYEIHRRMILRARTKGGVRDFALLHSAVERPKASYGGRELYPTLFSKAAGLLQSICLNHPFTDGNKRTAWLSTKWFLELNGWRLATDPEEGENFMIKVDNQKPDLLYIAKWLKEHSTKVA